MVVIFLILVVTGATIILKKPHLLKKAAALNLMTLLNSTLAALELILRQAMSGQSSCKGIIPTQSTAKTLLG